MTCSSKLESQPQSVQESMGIPVRSGLVSLPAASSLFMQTQHYQCKLYGKVLEKLDKGYSHPEPGREKREVRTRRVGFKTRRN